MHSRTAKDACIRQFSELEMLMQASVSYLSPGSLERLQLNELEAKGGGVARSIIIGRVAGRRT
jgi:hypothetical protein